MNLEREKGEGWNDREAKVAEKDLQSSTVSVLNISVITQVITQYMTHLLQELIRYLKQRLCVTGTYFKNHDLVTCNFEIN